LRAVTGEEYKVRNESGWRRVMLYGSALRHLVKGKLWRVVTWPYPKEFLQGVFDGGVGVGMCVKRRPEFRVMVKLTNSDLDVLDFARRLLTNLGIECSWPPQRKDRRGDVVSICGRECVLKRDCWELWMRKRESVERFAALINFRIERKRRVLEDAIRILREHESSRERVSAWLRLYEKRSGRWAPRHPRPPPLGALA